VCVVVSWTAGFLGIFGGAAAGYLTYAITRKVFVVLAWVSWKESGHLVRQPPPVLTRQPCFCPFLAQGLRVILSSTILTL
jgi:hypothetical protein